MKGVLGWQERKKGQLVGGMLNLQALGVTYHKELPRSSVAPVWIMMAQVIKPAIQVGFSK